jgi:hypothetical protein
MTTRFRGPRRSNSPLSIVRGIKTLKTIYATNARLRRYVLPYISARENHYRTALDRIDRLLANGRVIDGKHDPLRLLQEYDHRAPHESEIDRDRLLEVFESLDERAAERLAAIILAERDRLDMLGARRIPEVAQKRPFAVKQYPARFGKNEPRFAEHVPMTKETRELAKELRKPGLSAVIIDCQDEGAIIKISRDDEPEVFADRRRRKLWRRHVIRPKKKK